MWVFFKNIFTFKVNRKLFYDENFWITIPPYTDIYFYGAYIHTEAEYKLTKFIINEFHNKSNLIIFDVGANYGYYSLLFASICPNLIIYAFEPNPYALEILNLNKRENIKIILKAVGNLNGKIKFEKSHYVNSLASNVVLQNNEVNNEDIIEVEIISLDKFCEELNILPHFIKIDVEKIELEVLEGALNVLKTYFPILSLEFYFDEKFEYYKRIFYFLLYNGYEGFEIKFDGTLNKILDINNFRNNCLPKIIFDNLVFKKNENFPNF